MSAEISTSITNRLTTTTIMAHHNNAWKACNRQNRFGGSNPPHSAQNRLVSDDFAKDDQSIIKRKKVAHGGAKTAKQAHKMRKVDDANKKVLALLFG